jgi:hypothetical protein
MNPEPALAPIKIIATFLHHYPYDALSVLHINYQLTHLPTLPFKSWPAEDTKKLLQAMNDLFKHGLEVGRDMVYNALRLGHMNLIKVFWADHPQLFYPPLFGDGLLTTYDREKMEEGNYNIALQLNNFELLEYLAGLPEDIKSALNYEDKDIDMVGEDKFFEMCQ